MLINNIQTSSPCKHIPKHITHLSGVYVLQKGMNSVFHIGLIKILHAKTLSLRKSFSPKHVKLFYSLIIFALCSLFILSSPAGRTECAIPSTVTATANTLCRQLLWNPLCWVADENFQLMISLEKKTKCVFILRLIK